MFNDKKIWFSTTALVELICYARSTVLAIYDSATYKTYFFSRISHSPVVGMGIEPYCADSRQAEIHTCRKHSAMFSRGSHAVYRTVWSGIRPGTVLYYAICRIFAGDESENHFNYAFGVNANVAIAGVYICQHCFPRGISVNPLRHITLGPHVFSGGIVERHYALNIAFFTIAYVKINHFQ